MSVNNQLFFLQRHEQLSKLMGIADSHGDFRYLTQTPIAAICEELSQLTPIHYQEFSQVLNNSGSSQPLLQFRCGVGRHELQIDMLKALQPCADLLTVTIDSYTRQNDYVGGSNALMVEKSTQQRVLNGYPLIHHGINANRALIATLDKPVQVRHGTPDSRLLAELAFCSGYTAFEGGPITYCLPYAKKVSLAQAFRYWSYVEALIVEYQNHGRTINQESFAPLSGVLVPPILMLLVQILEGYWILRKGVRCLTLGITQLGSVQQDIVLQRVLKRIVQELLQPRFPTATISYVYHHWMGPFPKSDEDAYAIMRKGTFAAKLGGATKIIVKTTGESRGVPTLQDNINSLVENRRFLAQPAAFSETSAMHDEEEVLWQEIKHLLHVYGVDISAEGDITTLETLITQLFATGKLDIPMAPNLSCHGMVLATRDGDGDVRVLHAGHVPFSAAYLAHEAHKIEISADTPFHKKIWHSHNSLMAWSQAQQASPWSNA